MLLHRPSISYVHYFKTEFSDKNADTLLKCVKLWFEIFFSSNKLEISFVDLSVFCCKISLVTHFMCVYNLLQFVILMTTTALNPISATETILVA